MADKKIDKDKMNVTLTMSFDRACLLSRLLEAAARFGMGQFKDMMEIANPKLSYDQYDAMEKVLKMGIYPELHNSSYYGIGCHQVADECQNAWEAYQHLRREISWFLAGKDWRKDSRDWNTMWTVSYDNPFEQAKLPGKFKTDIKRKNETPNV